MTVSVKNIHTSFPPTRHPYTISNPTTCFLLLYAEKKNDSKVINKIFKNELNVSCTSSSSYKLPQASFLTTLKSWE
jgi:hypothetical protein